MEWRSGSSGRGPVLQVQSPEFKPESHKKKKKLSLRTLIKCMYLSGNP
jgi:hypothetical protein